MALTVFIENDTKFELKRYKKKFQNMVNLDEGYQNRVKDFS